MYEQKKTQNALVIGWGIGIALVAVMIVAKLVLKF
jgi:predicted nucleic acid-binding Zn ribbon protein